VGNNGALDGRPLQFGVDWTIATPNFDGLATENYVGRIDVHRDGSAPTNEFSFGPGL